MPQFGDWSDLTFDYVSVRKPYRDPVTDEKLVAVYKLRDDVPTSVMVRVYGILDLEEEYRALRTVEAGQKPDYERLAVVEERREGMTLRTLAGIFHHTYQHSAEYGAWSVAEWEPHLRRQFTDQERQELVALFFTRSLLSRRPPSDSTSPAAQPATATTGAKPMLATGQGATRGKSSSGSGKARAKTTSTGGR